MFCFCFFFFPLSSCDLGRSLVNKARFKQNRDILTMSVFPGCWSRRICTVSARYLRPWTINQPKSKTYSENELLDTRQSQKERKREEPRVTFSFSASVTFFNLALFVSRNKAEQGGSVKRRRKHWVCGSICLQTEWGIQREPLPFPALDKHLGGQVIQTLESAYFGTALPKGLRCGNCSVSHWIFHGQFKQNC